jgi:hypothetical protein
MIFFPWPDFFFFFPFSEQKKMGVGTVILLPQVFQSASLQQQY